MKIKVKKESYDVVCNKIHFEHRSPLRPMGLLRKIIRLAAQKDLRAVNFSFESDKMDLLPSDEPCLILMNHSSFIDLEICAEIFKERPYNIVCTSDGFVGKEWLMRHIGCIPTQKFVPDPVLIKDMHYALTKLRTSVLMFPEASYSFDGTATPLPESLGKCIRLLKVPVVLVNTEGAFHRDPLYNGLQLRNVNVSAKVTYLFSPEQIKELSVSEINRILADAFSFDHFRWQMENKIKITEPFRADHLNRVLYKCPHCGTEGKMLGKGITLTCQSCGVTYELTEYGSLTCLNDVPGFQHIPDWYRWERESVREELLNHTYSLETKVKILMLVDMKQIYEVGTGILTHTEEGFRLTGCDGALNYEQKPKASYSLYADYFWYELGDMICIGDQKKLFYCFPLDQADIAAKTRLATEELYKICNGIVMS
ncbi:MAG: 1-acyl-sn-glycerol-3-phosphate acyltransferase [Eubacteriales bacterium]|nr:1-acyl-sn-glycerol-3-phosphate acyltransferase [Eubacteriales bacterium]